MHIIVYKFVFTSNLGLIQFNLFPFLLWCIHNTTLSAALVRATPARVKCAVCRTVKVICRRARECTIEKKTIHTY